MIPSLPDALIPVMQGVCFISSIVTATLAEPAINRMSPCTRFSPRLAFHLLFLGAVGNALWLLLGDQPNFPETTLSAGVAMLLICDRLFPRRPVVTSDQKNPPRSQISMITREQLAAIIPNSGPKTGVFMMPINDAMAEFGIDTPARQAAFIAQVAYESGGLRYVVELANGAAYEGRADLGNTHPGDGCRYKGRGLIQITGRFNYLSCSLALFGDDRLIEHPDLLETTTAACRSAAWFWQTNGCNELADNGNFERITRRINGGLNGHPDRLALYEKAKAALSC
jgi:putative chitinase